MQLEEISLSAQVCSQMLEHGICLLEDFTTTAPLLDPSTLKLSVTYGDAAPDVASAAADLLAAHSNACQADALQSNPVQQLSPQSTPAQPDLAQPKPPHPQENGSHSPLPGLASWLGSLAGRLPGKNPVGTADKAEDLALPVAAQQALAVPEVLWQVFAYAEKAGLQLTVPAARLMWASQVMPGAMPTCSFPSVGLVLS